MRTQQEGTREKPEASASGPQERQPLQAAAVTVTVTRNDNKWTHRAECTP